MKKILMRFIYWILMEEAKITVNTTCFGPYYQGKIDKQLDILKNIMKISYLNNYVK